MVCVCCGVVVGCVVVVCVVCGGVWCACGGVWCACVVVLWVECVWWCGVCGVCGGVWCGTLEKNRVSIPNVPVCTGTTRSCVTGRFEYTRTGGEVRGGGGEGGGPPSVLLTKICPHWDITCCRGSPKEPLDVTHFQFENRSRITRSRVLQSFALPDEAVELQLS